MHNQAVTLLSHMTNTHIMQTGPHHNLTPNCTNSVHCTAICYNHVHDLYTSPHACSCPPTFEVMLKRLYSTRRVPSELPHPVPVRTRSAPVEIAG